MEILDVLVGDFVSDCGGNLAEYPVVSSHGNVFYCEACKDYTQCGQLAKAREINSKLQSLVAGQDSVHVWVDGWCKNNGKPGARAGWSVVVVVDGKPHSTKTGIVYGPQTSNVAEYQAFIGGLRWGQGYDRPMVIHTDSALVVGQVTQEWKVKAKHLELFVGVARTLVALTGAKIVKEPREKIVEVLGH